MNFEAFLERTAEEYRADAAAHAKGTTEYNDAMALFHDSMARSLAAKSSKTAKRDEITKIKLKAKEEKHREKSKDLERKSE